MRAGKCEAVLWLKVTLCCRYTDFWVTSNVFLARLYRSPLVTVAAIKGACPAGGCCLSLCCDVRIMTEQVRLLVWTSISARACSGLGNMQWHHVSVRSCIDAY